jgi:hypothetical protein
MFSLYKGNQYLPSTTNQASTPVQWSVTRDSTNNNVYMKVFCTPRYKYDALLISFIARSSTQQPQRIQSSSHFHSRPLAPLEPGQSYRAAQAQVTRPQAPARSFHGALLLQPEKLSPTTPPPCRFPCLLLMPTRVYVRADIVTI